MLRIKFKLLLNKLLISISIESNQKKLKKFNLFMSLISLIFITKIFFEYRNKLLIKFLFFSPSFYIAVISYLAAAYLWSKLMKDNYGGNILDYFYNWCFSKIGKYIPSGLMLFSVRLNQKNTINKNPKSIFYGLIQEQFIFPLVQIPALAICIINNLNFNIFLLYGILSFLIFYLLKFIFYKLRNNAKTLLNYPIVFLVISNLQLLILFNIAVYLNYQNPSKIALYYFLSSSLGLLFVGVPAGIGIREFIFYKITNNFLDETIFLEYVLSVRILFLLVDLLFGIVGFFKTYNKNV